MLFRGRGCRAEASDFLWRNRVAKLSQNRLTPCFVGGKQDDFQESQAVKKQAQSLHDVHIRGMPAGANSCAVSDAVGENIAHMDWIVLVYMGQQWQFAAFLKAKGI